MRTALKLATVLAAFAASAPPAFAAPQVTVEWSGAFQPFGAGYTVEAFCVAYATTDDPGLIPVSTSVTCKINGFAKTDFRPGPVAAVEVHSTATAPLRICRSGYSDYAGGPDPIRFEFAEDCVLIVA